MLKRVSLLVVVVMLVAPVARAQTPPPAIVIQRVNVVDVRAGKVLSDHTVVVEQGRIARMGKGLAAKMPEGTLIVDGRKKYLIPGLWDMHVHAAWPGLNEMFAPQFVANGVTGVREMYGSLFLIRAWKAKYQSGEPWPRMIGAGHILDGPKPFWPGSKVAGNADEAREAVRSLHDSGADFIKVYSKLPPDAYFAALEEAKKIGTYCAGHVPDAVSVADASDHGQRSIEHLTGVSLECSKEVDELRAQRAAAAADTTGALLKTYAQQAERVLATQDRARASALFAKLAKNETWMVPTFTVLRSIGMLNDEKFTADPRVRYMPESMVMQWDWKNDFRFKNKKPEDWEAGKKLYKLSIANVGKMNKAGVPIMAGTDFLNPYTFAGFSLHDELGLLVEAGLSPAEALRAATINPAIFMNATDSLGTVDVGKRADLVLLDANPLKNIHNTTRVRAVVLNGRLYDRAALDALLSEAEKKVRPPR